MVCEYCDWREDHYARMSGDSDPRPLKTLIEKEKEIAMPGACSSAGEALNRQIEKNKLKAKMLFRCALRGSETKMTRERATTLANLMTCTRPVDRGGRINAAYPCHELIVEMEDGSVFTINTDSYNAYDVANISTSIRDYFQKELGWDPEDIDHLIKVNDIIVPGAKNIYVIEM